MLRDELFQLIRKPLSARFALFCAALSVALPTLARAAVNGTVTGCEFTPYLPFVLLSAMLLRWWQAAMVALVSVAILGGLFVGHPDQFLESACFVSGAGIFLGASAMMIGTAMLVRRMMDALQKRGTNEGAGGVIFCLEEGEVWASWHGQGPPVRLGSKKRVAAMMKDFLDHADSETSLTRRFW